MRLICLVVALMSCCAVCFAGQYQIRTRSVDFVPGDGFMEAGSPSNPYVVVDGSGQVVETIHSRSTCFNPGSGFMEQGSPSNPYIAETND